MEFVLIPLTALVASGLTLISGFGLGTLLFPVMALFFDLPTAMAITAVVHMLNNVFKLGLMGRHVDWGVFGRFAITALPFAFIGAGLMVALANASVWFEYVLLGHRFEVKPLGLSMGGLLLLMVAIKHWPSFKQMKIRSSWLSLGGAISGFFGGLSGHQGAFRSLFLMATDLNKQSFIATGVVIAVAIDVVRTAVYGWYFYDDELVLDVGLITVTTLAAFIGALLGRRWLEKVTLAAVHRVVTWLLVILGLAMVAGWIQ